MSNLEVKLKDGDNVLFPQAMIGGMDTANQLYFSHSTSYNSVIEEDCYLFFRGYTSTTIDIDGVQVLWQNSGVIFTNAFFPLKKGQRLTISTGSYNSNIPTIALCGVKH